MRCNSLINPLEWRAFLCFFLCGIARDETDDDVNDGCVRGAKLITELLID